MRPPDRLAVHWDEVCDVLSRLILTSVPKNGPLANDLKACADYMAAGDFAKAQRSAGAAHNAARDLGFIYGSADTIRGIASMYLGAAHHAQGELDDALLHYHEAETDFAQGYDDKNTQVAGFAEALVYAWQGQTAKTNELTQLLAAHGWNAAALNELKQRCKVIEDCVAAERDTAAATTPPAVTAPATPGSAPEPLEHVLVADVADPPEPGSSYAWIVRLAILVAAAIAVVFVIIELRDFASSWVVAVVGLLTLGFAGLALYFILSRRLTVDTPPNCWTVLKRGTEYKVITTQPVIRRPFDQVHAFVPLNTYQAPISKQRVMVAPDAAVDLELRVSYTLHRSDPASRSDEVMRAIAVALESAPRRNGGSPQKTLSPADLRRGWEKRLQSDVAMTLLDVVPKHDPQDLYCDRSAGINRVSSDLREKLDTRVRRWGLRIEEARISDCTQVRITN